MNKNVNVIEEFLKVVAVTACIVSILGVAWGILILLGIL